MTRDQAEELRALIRVYATRRVRKFAVSQGIGSAFETRGGVDRASAKAGRALDERIEELTTKQTA